MIKELIYLIKLLFTKQSDELEIVKMKHFPFTGYSAMSWCGKLITKQTYIDDILINHELIHLHQALHFTSWISYYLTYLWYWLKGKSFTAASYYTIPFEMEAYGNEKDLNYVPTKDSWRKYIIENRITVYKSNKYNWRQYCNSINNKA